MPDGSVVVAGGQGFYGDTPTAVDALLEEGIDYLCLEALAELTLAILQKDRQRDEARGYTRDLPAYLARALPYVVDGRTKVITNAGGINPTAAAHAAIESARQLGLPGITVATVVGDDVLGRLDRLREHEGQSFAHLDTGAAFETFPGPPLFASAYLGARPIAEALAQGADIVITGRVADASLFLAPIAHEHGWAWDDWDRLAAGIVVGHLLECSGQSIGGNYSGDWWALPHPWDLPYPIATVDDDGTAVISKPARAGGRVSTDTLRHQLLYEVHDPARYLAPDVVADFTSVAFELLLSAHAGWSGETRVAFSWPDAYEKAKATAAIFVKRVEMAGLPVDEWCVEYWGVNALGGPTVPPLADGSCEPPECVLRVAWRCTDQRTAGLVGRELVPLTLSAPPAGLTGAGRGPASATELLSIWPTLIDKAVVDSEVRVVLETVS